MEKINLQAILAKYNPTYTNKENKIKFWNITSENALKAMEDLWIICTDKCVENFTINHLESWGQKTGETEIDENTIEQVKDMII